MLDRWLSGSPSNDPLYLTNRSFLQKAGVWAIVALPFMAGVLFLVLLSKGAFNREPMQPAAILDPKPVDVGDAAVPRPEQSPEGRDVEVSNVEVLRGAGAILRGKVKNLTARTIPSADITLAIIDGVGKQVGTVSVRVTGIGPQSTVDFRRPVNQPGAYSAYAREVRTR